MVQVVQRQSPSTSACASSVQTPAAASASAISRIFADCRAFISAKDEGRSDGSEPLRNLGITSKLANARLEDIVAAHLFYTKARNQLHVKVEVIVRIHGERIGQSTTLNSHKDDDRIAPSAL